MSFKNKQTNKPPPNLKNSKYGESSDERKYSRRSGSPFPNGVRFEDFEEQEEDRKSMTSSRESLSRRSNSRYVPPHGRNGRKGFRPRSKSREDEKRSSGDKIYSLNNVTTLVPTARLFVLNMDGAGYATLVEQTWVTMTSRDTRIKRAMPRCFFYHFCVQLHNLVRITQACENQMIPFANKTELASLFNFEEVLIPKPIAEYLANIGTAVCHLGNTTVINCPEIAVPKPTRTVRIPPAVEGAEADAAEFEVGGDFGPVTEITHNVYEAYFAPVVTKRLIENTAASVNLPEPPATWRPLPAGLVPEGLTPTRNLLGYWPIEVVSSEAKSQLENIRWETYGVKGRLCFSADVWNVVQGTLQKNQDVIEIHTGIPFKPAVERAELAFVSSEGAVLKDADAISESFAQLTLAEVNQLTLFQYRRERTATSPGTCYLQGAAVPPNWLNTINQNFNGEEPFTGTVGTVAAPIWNNGLWTQTSVTDRSIQVNNWIRDHFLVEKK